MEGTGCVFTLVVDLMIIYLLIRCVSVPANPLPAFIIRVVVVLVVLLTLLMPITALCLYFKVL